MIVEDLEGQIQISSAVQLLARLTSIRKGNYGAFILSHDEDGPSLSLHINGDIAYLHYFPSQTFRHPGFQASGMAPEKCEDSVRFVQVGGERADDITMPRHTLVSIDTAYKAALEFQGQSGKPRSIEWVEL
jgi:hypothetical protein